MKRISASILFWLALFGVGLAQSVTNPAPVGDSAAYNSSAPTCTNGQFCFLQTDINGNLKTVGSGTPTGTQTIQGAVNVTPTDCSGTVTLGGTAQNAFTAQAALHGFTIVNLSTDPMWISFTGTAVIGASASYLLAAGSSTTQGGSYSSPLGFGMNTALSLIAATTGDKFSCTRW